MLWTLFIVGLLGESLAVKKISIVGHRAILCSLFLKVCQRQYWGGGSFLRFLIYALAIVTLVNYEKLCRKQLSISLLFIPA